MAAMTLITNPAGVALASEPAKCTFTASYGGRAGAQAEPWAAARPSGQAPSAEPYGTEVWGEEGQQCPARAREWP